MNDGVFGTPDGREDGARTTIPDFAAASARLVASAASRCRERCATAASAADRARRAIQRTDRAPSPRRCYDPRRGPAPRPAPDGRARVPPLRRCPTRRRLRGPSATHGPAAWGSGRRSSDLRGRPRCRADLSGCRDCDGAASPSAGGSRRRHRRRACGGTASQRRDDLRGESDRSQTWRCGRLRPIVRAPPLGGLRRSIGRSCSERECPAAAAAGLAWARTGLLPAASGPAPVLELPLARALGRTVVRCRPDE